MRNALDRLFRALEQFLGKRLGTPSRLLLLAGSGLLALTFFFPLWHINLIAPQYRDGLDMWIYTYQLVGGNGGQDIAEINLLNHYIGMAEIHEADFWEMRFLPFAIGFFILLGLRAAVFGQVKIVVDYLVLFLYFSLFSLGSFVYRLYSYGHELDPTAPMNVDPFWPTLVGTKQIANMTETSLPGVSSYLIAAAVLCAALSLWLARHEPPIFSTDAEASP